MSKLLIIRSIDIISDIINIISQLYLLMLKNNLLSNISTRYYNILTITKHIVPITFKYQCYLCKTFIANVNMTYLKVRIKNEGLSNHDLDFHSDCYDIFLNKWLEEKLTLSYEIMNKL